MLPNREIYSLLKKAIRNHSFEYVYQPIYDLELNKFTKFEMLIRLNDHRYGYISPGQFIPIAERFNLMYQIGLQVIEEACKKILCLENLNIEFDSICINISALQLENSRFYTDVLSFFEHYKINPEKITFEITETSDIKSISNVNDLLTSFSNLGITLAIDDFGTGYNSFSKILNLPLKSIKIDRSIIDAIPHCRKARITLKHLLNFSDDMNLHAVAEGVESRDTLNILRDHKCRFIQGFYFSKPLKFNDLCNIMSSELNPYLVN